MPIEIEIDIPKTAEEREALRVSGGWYRWYANLPDDLKRRLSIHDFKRLGDVFRQAFEIPGTRRPIKLGTPEMSADMSKATAPSARELAVHPSRWRHRKRGTSYNVLTATAGAQCATGPINEGDHVTVYQGDDGNWWVRPTAEFQDGRFERIDLTEGWPAASEQAELLAALRKMLDHFHGVAAGPGTAVVIRDARVALAKAEERG